MQRYFFVSDLHGRTESYEKLFETILNEKPEALFLGGDLLPHHFAGKNFVNDFLVPKLISLREELKSSYPKIFLILGNDDARSEEKYILAASESNIFQYIHFSSAELEGRKIFGYSFTPPSPFLLKDWEKFDVSRYTEHGSISPEEGKRTVEIAAEEKKYSTIEKDLKILTDNEDVSNAIFLFHGPPYKTNLDRVALDGKRIDHAEVDLHVGSIAIKRFIEKFQPHITLHGHIHESARITGNWKDKIGKSYCFSAAHDGPELSLVKFDSDKPEETERYLI